MTLPLHWNQNVVILMKFSSLIAPKVVKMTTFGAASDENFIKMTSFRSRCITACYINLMTCQFAWRHHVMVPEMSPCITFIREIQQLLVDSPPKGPVMQNSGVCFVVALNMLLNKQFAGDLRCDDVHVTSPQQAHPKFIHRAAEIFPKTILGIDIISLMIHLYPHWRLL